MGKTLLVTSLALCLGIQVSMAQCEKCNMLASESYDFCFTDDEFPNVCAQFGINQNDFRIKSGKKPKIVPIKGDFSLDYLKEIALNSKLKISAYEILFIDRALEAWKIEQRKFGHSYTDSGLGYRVTSEGDGEIPVAGDRVNVHYIGYLENGTEFDNSYKRNKPFTFSIGQGQVIGGWDEGIALLKRGTKAILRIPPNLGYGGRKVGAIPANSTLYFEIELLKE